MKVSSLENSKEIEVSHNSKIKKRVLVADGEIEHITNFSRAVFPVGETVDAHSHSDMTEVFFVESGEGLILVDGKHTVLQTGVCITVEPDEVHQLSNTGAGELVLLYFGLETTNADKQVA